MKPYTYLSIILLSLTFPAMASESLEQLINQRLGHMHDVARYKWLKNLPIEDLDREATVLDAAERSGLQLGITRQSSRRFFAEQISAAKEIQRYWFQQWKEGRDVPTRAPDLRSEIRPQLIELGDKILIQLANSRPKTLNIAASGLSDDTAERLSSAAENIQQYPHRLAQILDSGVLRVGTTFDYAPFSYQKDGEANGIDIALAKDLGRVLGVQVEWVHTSWPTLMKDLHSGLYDIGMSGISLNLERQKTAFFSVPHHTGGKTAIGQCSNQERFNTFDLIDQTTTRIIVNPGGTNQRFVDSNIQNANVRVHPDNRTIFYELLNDQADLMFTDAIEVQLQTAKHKELCGLLDGETLTFQEKGFLLPQDIELKLYVDAWLKQRQAEGLVKEIFSHHLTSTMTE